MCITKSKLLAAASSFAAIALSQTAIAVTVTTNETNAIGRVSIDTIGSNGQNVTVTPPITSATAVGNLVAFNSQANAQGVSNSATYRTQVSGRSNAAPVFRDVSAFGNAGYVQTVTNTTAGRVNVTLNFFIEAGEISYFDPFGISPAVGNRPRGQVAFGSDILVDFGTGFSSVWDGSLIGNYVDGIAPGWTTIGAFSSLSNLSTTSIGATWQSTSFTVTLGEIDPGQSFTYSYALGTSVVVGQPSCASLTTLGGTLGGTAIGCAGLQIAAADPGQLNPLGIRFTTVSNPNPNPTPEPGTIAVLAAGLAGLGLARRARRARG
jgi:hypothetical protein